MFANLTAKARRRSDRNVRPALDGLGDRIVPASIAFDTMTGVITVTGDNTADTVHAKIVSGHVYVTEKAPGVSLEKRVPVTQVTMIRFIGNNGNDMFVNDTFVKSRASGGLGNDTLIGGSSRDDLFGDDGQDRIEGREGDDLLSGGAGNDTLMGGKGHDLMLGGANNDFLMGGTGNDTLKGEAGADSLFGEDDNDDLYKDAADLVVDGGAGVNNVF